MKSKKRNAAREYILAILSLGVSLGTGMNTAQASTGAIAITDPNYKLSHNVTYTGTTGGSNPAAILYVSPKASHGTISIDTVDMEGNFTSPAGDTGKGVNSNGILIGSGYQGTLDLADSADIQVTGEGNRIQGAGIYSSQEGTGNPEAAGTSIHLGDSVRIHYTANSGDATAYGIYNNNGALKNDAGSIYVTVDGKIGSFDSDRSKVLASGIYNGGSATTSLNGLFLYSTFTSAGQVSGDISGIESDHTGSTAGSITVGGPSFVNVSFTGKGNTDQGNALNTRAIGLTNASFTGGDWNSYSNVLTSDSTAHTISGTEMDHSTASFGEYTDHNVTAETGSAVKDAYGLLLRNQSAVNGKDYFNLNVDVKGRADQADGIRLLSGSSLKLGTQASLTNTIEDAEAVNEGTMVTAINATEDSQITMGENAHIVMKAWNQNVSNVTGINLADSHMEIGMDSQGDLDSTSAIAVYGSHTRYDGNAQVCGVAVSGTGQNAEDRRFVMGQGSFIGVAGNNVGTILGLSNSSDGTIELEGPGTATINVIQGTQGNPGEISNDGYADYVAGIRNDGKGKVILKGDNQILVGARTKTEGATVYGIDNINSDVEADNLRLLTRTRGHADTIGIHNAARAHTTIRGQATIEAATKDNDVQSEDDAQPGYAVWSQDPDSLVEITGDADKTIIGNLYAKNRGEIRLSLNTPDSLLLGMSQVENGTTDLSLSNGSLWAMTKDSTVSALSLKNGATIDMTRNQDKIEGVDTTFDLTGNPEKYQTLHIGNFSGNGGIFKMKTDLASQTDGDKVFIDSAAPGSSGIISVYDKSLATGKKVTGAKHLLLVTDPSRHTTFTGKDLDTGGLWEITPTIEQGGTFTDADGNRVGTRDQWYLATLAKKINPDTVPVIKNLDTTYGLYRQSLDTLRQRLGDLRYRNRSTDKYDIWARNRGGSYEGNGYEGRYNFFQVGLDTMPDAKSAYGFLAERGIGSPNFTTGSGRDHTLAGALYGTWLGDDGSYTDVVAKVGRDDTTLHTYGKYADSADYRENQQSLSVEYGRTVPMGKEGWFVEPQAQFVAGHLSSNAYTTSRGTHVYEDGYHSAIGRLGFVLGKKQQNGKNPYDFYVKASLLHEFGGDRDYTLNRINAYGDPETLDGRYGYKDTWWEVGFGGDVKLNRNTIFYADVERSFSSTYTKKWQVNAGLNWNF